MSEIAMLADDGELAGAKRLGQRPSACQQRGFVGAQRERAGEVLERLLDELAIPGRPVHRSARVMEIDQPVDYAPYASVWLAPDRRRIHRRPINGGLNEDWPAAEWLECNSGRRRRQSARSELLERRQHRRFVLETAIIVPQPRHLGDQCWTVASGREEQEHDMPRRLESRCEHHG
jgi:hypothetical protein